MQQITVVGTEFRRTYGCNVTFQWDALGVLLLLSCAKRGVLQNFAQQAQRSSTVTVKTAKLDLTTLHSIQRSATAQVRTRAHPTVGFGAAQDAFWGRDQHTRILLFRITAAANAKKHGQF